MEEMLPIAQSARKHGIADADMRFAVANFLREVWQDDRSLFIGPSRSGVLLEIIVLDPDGDPVIIHAHTLQPSREHFLTEGD